MFHKICKPSILVFLKYKTGKYMHFGKTYNLFNRILWSRKAGFNAKYKYTQCIMANYFTQSLVYISLTYICCIRVYHQPYTFLHINLIPKRLNHTLLEINI